MSSDQSRESDTSGGDGMVEESDINVYDHREPHDDASSRDSKPSDDVRLTAYGGLPSGVCGKSLDRSPESSNDTIHQVSGDHDDTLAKGQLNTNQESTMNPVRARKYQFGIHRKKRRKKEPSDPEITDGIPRVKVETNPESYGKSHELTEVKSESLDIQTSFEDRDDQHHVYPVRLNPSDRLARTRRHKPPDVYADLDPPTPLNLVRADHDENFAETTRLLDLRQVMRADGMLKIEVNDPIHPVAAGTIKYEEQDEDYSVASQKESGDVGVTNFSSNVFPGNMSLPAPMLDIREGRRPAWLPLPIFPGSLNNNAGMLNTSHKCEKCLTFFRNFGNLVRHALLHSNGNDSCKISRRRSIVHRINDKAKSRKTLTQKQFFKMDKKSTNLKTCELCDQSFRRQESLVLHTSRSHKGCRRFSCDHCGETFELRSMLIRHSLTHVEERPFKCEKCTRAFRRSIQLESHKLLQVLNESFRSKQYDATMSLLTKSFPWSQQRSGTGPFQCHLCNNKTFPSRASLKRHLQTHDQDGPYQCELCDAAFQAYYDLLGHRLTHNGAKAYRCDFCSKAFAQRKTLLDHRRLHTMESVVICDECGKIFTHERFLELHKRTHSGEKPYKCDQCDKAFIAERYLRSHKRHVHLKERPFMCDICGRMFARREGLIQHHNIHTGEKPYKCEECGLAWGARSNLSQHKLKVHSDKWEQLKQKSVEKPYKCEKCEKTFKFRHLLRSHQIVHTGERPYRCDQCEKSFPHESTLKGHKVRIHGTVKPFACDQCDKRYPFQKDLRKHKKFNHEGLKFECEVCHRVFNNNAYLERHKDIHTGIKRFKCNLCDKAFTRKVGLIDHQRIHTGEKQFRCELCDKEFTQHGGLRQHMRSHSLKKKKYV